MCPTCSYYLKNIGARDVRMRRTDEMRIITFHTDSLVNLNFFFFLNPSLCGIERVYHEFVICTQKMIIKSILIKYFFVQQYNIHMISRRRRLSIFQDKQKLQKYILYGSIGIIVGLFIIAFGVFAWFSKKRTYFLYGSNNRADKTI